MKAVRSMMLVMLFVLSMLTDAQFYLPLSFVDLHRWRGNFNRIAVANTITTNNFCSNVCNADPICIVDCNYFTSGGGLPLPDTPPPLPSTTPTTSPSSTASTTTPITTTISTTTPATTATPTTTPATTATSTTTSSTTPSSTASTSTTTPATTTTITTTSTSLPSNPPSNPNLNVTTCEAGVLAIKCPVITPNQPTITVLKARYGRYNQNVCPGPNQQNTSCDKDVTNVLSSICGNKINCAFVADSEHLGGDPCVGTYKYLEMVYNCV